VRTGDRIIFTESDLAGRIYTMDGIIDYITEPPNKSMLVKIPNERDRIVFPEQIKEIIK